MKTICIIQGHPDCEKPHFCHAIAESYEQGATTAGHKVYRLEVAKMEFSLLKSKQEHEHGEVPADIKMAQTYIQQSDHLVIIYPLWCGGMPARLKGFFEVIMRPGFSHDLEAGFFKGRLLKNKSAHVIITMGMPAWFYRYFYFAHSLKSLKRNILHFSGITPVRDTIIGMIEAPNTNHKKWLQKIHELGQRAR